MKYVPSVEDVGGANVVARLGIIHIHLLMTTVELIQVELLENYGPGSRQVEQLNTQSLPVPHRP